MTIIQEFDSDFQNLEDDGTARRLPRKRERVKQLLFDGEVDGIGATTGECQVESCANGGFKLVIREEDEFMFERKTEIIFDPLDLEIIERLRGLKLI